jgi:ABC-type taurine transport system ATPase subunit
MNLTIQPLLKSVQSPVEAIQDLTTLGRSGTDRFTQLNIYASLAAIDNSAHYFSTLAKSQGVEDLIEFQIQSLLPAAESAKAYVSQVLALAATTSREYEQLIQNQMSKFQDCVYEGFYAGLTKVEENGALLAMLLKDTLSVAREAASSKQALIKRVV